MDEYARRTHLESELLDWMAEPEWHEDDGRFERIALALFQVQFELCAPYGRFCKDRGITPDTIERWTDIPAVPTGAFKEVALRCFPREHTLKTFRTSGTSADRRGELHLDTLDLYEASLLPTLRTLLFPDGAPHHLRFLAPSADEAPDSSLSHMFDTLGRDFARSAETRVGFDVHDGQLDVEAVTAALQRAVATAEPIALCGTAFAFVHLLEALEASSTRFRCPAGSRLMETGGFKGKSREMPRDELHAWMHERLGVPRNAIVNQYGMTELGSQFYDSVIVDPNGPRRKLGPPWIRVRVVDPENRRDVAPGQVGMITLYDLANTGSVAAIETADLGRTILGADHAANGFEVLGRAEGAEARGCSIAADVMLGGADPSP